MVSNGVHAQVLPPGIDAAKFNEILDDLTKVVGAENVSRDSSSGSLEGPHKQHSYGDPYELDTENPRTPSGAVRPTKVEEVQEIVRLANKHNFPLWVVSRGKNLGYGGTAPVVKGSVVLDLHRMNRIIEVNEEYSYAIVEPGVSFFDLYNYIQEKKLKLWPSCPAIGWGSIVGNCTDRGFGYTPNGEHTASQCGMEVVLPNGELLRTGMAAMENSSLYALFKGGYGPSVDGLFIQSNLGIVTQIGMQMTPAPEYYMSCEVSVLKEDELPVLVGTLTSLMRRKIINNFPSVSNLFRQAIFHNKPHIMAQIGPHFGEGKYVPQDVLEKVAAEEGMGFWNAQFALYGPEEVVQGSWKAIQRAFAKVPGVIFREKTSVAQPGEVLTTTDVGSEDIPHTGIPTLDPFQLMYYRGGELNRHMCFSPILPPSGRELYSWYVTAKKRTTDAKFDFFADFHLFPHYIIGIELWVFTPAEGPKTEKLYRDLLTDAVSQGFTEYRTHLNFMDDVAHHFDFNNGALGKYFQKLKDTMDPNGVLSPGKSGIWNLKPAASQKSTIL